MPYYGEMATRRLIAYTPSNIDFLSIPAECLIKDWGASESDAILTINRIYGMTAALSGDLQALDPMEAYEAVNASLRRFWDAHHSDTTLPTWNERKCLKMAKQYWMA